MGLSAAARVAPDAPALPRHTWWPAALGVGALTVVIVVALRGSEARELADLARQARPAWLVWALAAQFGTYLAQAHIWRAVATVDGGTLPWGAALQLSLAKLFADQALPSAGVSSSVLIVSALERRGVERGVRMATVAINMASYHAAYIVGLISVLVLAFRGGYATTPVVLVAVAFMVFCVGLVTTVMLLAGRPTPGPLIVLTRWPALRSVVAFLRDADPRLTRNPRLLVDTTAAQLCIIAFDTATMVALLRSLGAPVGAVPVFVSFMTSSLFRTVSIIPGGLGTFEASAVITLRLVGVPVAAALSATLLFRGLSFWLPMLPGWWCTRRVLAARSAVAARPPACYWAMERGALFDQLKSGASGLSAVEAERRLIEFGRGGVVAKRPTSRFHILGRQLSNPLLWLLIMASALSAGTGEWSDAAIVLTIVVVTVGLGYIREHGAARALEILEARVRTMATVLRDGAPVSVARDAIVTGDVIVLSAGSLVPADAVVLEASHCFVSEALLTGESFSNEKRPGAAAEANGVSQRTNCVYLGTNVQSGTASCLVVATGTATEFARIAAHLQRRAPETDFDRGIRRFGYLLTVAMLLLTLLVFVAHVLNGRPPIETLLFSVALAVGLSPELLPAILSVNLTRGAQSMARRGVLVRRLTAIENLGSMDVLCTDKTGTLTEGAVRLDGAYDWAGASSAGVLELGALNAALQTGLNNPLDDALLQAHRPDLSGIHKVAEIPFDFSRKRIGLVVENSDGRQLIVKGAFESLVGACSHLPDGRLLHSAGRSDLVAKQQSWSCEGTRVIAVASRPVAAKAEYSSDDEADLQFDGFLTFLDRPKVGVAEALADLNRLGVSVKIITGDNRLVSQHVAGLVGMRGDRMLTGAEISQMSGAALWHMAPRTDLFVEVDPTQKEQIILALKRSGHVVGFMGDGVNDAPAMHAADTSISVEGAVDVAREAADFVLLERDLDVLRGGIEEGRRTFANTLKYILTTMSANLGNMISMALASLALPFLPLLAGQILLNNLLSDIPAIGIADDSVDLEMVEQPPRWDMKFIARFMIEFGVLSSLFDMLTFGLLLWGFHVSAEGFRTAWFVESLLSELAVALVVRTHRPFFRSRPGTLLLALTSALAVVAVVIPYLPFAAALGFIALPATVLVSMVGITVAYVAVTELGKMWFYRTRGQVRA